MYSASLHMCNNVNMANIQKNITVVIVININIIIMLIHFTDIGCVQFLDSSHGDNRDIVTYAKEQVTLLLQTCMHTFGRHRRTAGLRAGRLAA